MLDTSVIVGAERRRFNFVEFLKAEASSTPLFVSAMTVSELLHGVYRSDDARRTKRQAFVNDVLSGIPVLSFDSECANRHAMIRADLEKEGNMICPYDLIIAATALTFGHNLATLNEKEFERVPGLSLANTREYLSVT